MESKQWNVQIYITEVDNLTSAHAVLTTRDAQLTGTGSAHRNPIDPLIPEIGDELAAARALADLSGKLIAISSEDISHLR